jgi:hypothetical protein
MARFKGAPAGRFVFSTANCGTATADGIGVNLREGDVWAADDPLVLLRPGLFADEPPGPQSPPHGGGRGRLTRKAVAGSLRWVSRTSQVAGSLFPSASISMPSVSSSWSRIEWSVLTSRATSAMVNWVNVPTTPGWPVPPPRSSAPHGDR